MVFLEVRTLHLLSLLLLPKGEEMAISHAFKGVATGEAGEGWIIAPAPLIVTKTEAQVSLSQKFQASKI